jgi:hypothetical protein
MDQVGNVEDLDLAQRRPSGKVLGLRDVCPYARTDTS